jgi:hypothetical protein
MHRTEFLLAVFLLAVPGIAAAQQPTQAQIGAIKQSCRSDYQANCSGVPTGGSAALQCLQGHMGNLSPSCQTAVSAAMGGGSAASTGQAPPPNGPSATGRPPPMSMREQAALVRQSCSGDFHAYCQGLRPGGGRALACLSENQSRLSPPCRDALAEAKATR